MKVSIEIDLPHEDESPLWELVQIIRLVSKKIDNNSVEIEENLHKFGEDDGKILNLNGSSIGTWKLSK